MKVSDPAKKKSFGRTQRYFSDEFKRKKVDEIDKRLTSISEICREYEVSYTSVYKWIYKYSLMRKKSVRLVLEPESDTIKIKALKQHVSELEQLLGQKQFELDFMKKQLDIVSETFGVDVKKKPIGKPFSGSGTTGKNTGTK